MKNVIHISISILVLSWIACLSPPVLAAAPDCAGKFFSPDDFNHEHPLRKPYPEFLRSYKRALAGDAVEQRNVAVSYDAGYLISACPARAHFWYQKAAANRDPIAQNWIDHYNEFKTILDGPEFAIINSIAPPQAVEPAQASATKLSAERGPQAEPTSAEGMLTQLNRSSNSAPDPENPAKVLRLLSSLMK